MNSIKSSIEPLEPTPAEHPADSDPLKDISVDSVQTPRTMSLDDWSGSVTMFDGFTGTRPVKELVDVEWPALLEVLCPKAPAVIADKAQGQYFIPCPLKEAPLIGNTLEAAKEKGQSTIGKMRSKDHVTKAEFITIDIDGMSEPDFMAGLTKIAAADVAYAAYTTFSHGSEDKPGMRVRVIVPVDRRMSIEEYEAAWHGADALFWSGQAGKADPSGAKMYQQQGTWACDPGRIDDAKSWRDDNGKVASANRLIAAGSARQELSAAPSRKYPQRSGLGIDTEMNRHQNIGSTDFPPSDANKVADSCKQIGAFRTSRGVDQSEPLWYDCLGIVGFCIDGEKLSQEWSSGYSEYSERKTAQKLAYRLKTPPTTCGQFRKTHPAGCQGCQQQCNSPITLGWQTPSPEAFQVIQPLEIDTTATSSAAAETPKTDQEVIERLATMPLMDYDRARQDAANTLGVQVRTLDTLVKKARKEGGETAKSPFADVKPCPNPINPAQLLDQIASTIRQFIIMDPEQADAAALWILLTWVIDDVQVAPLVIINAPEKACGKSQLLDVIGRLSARSLPAANATPASLFRSVDRWQPTILIDEADTFLRDNDELKGLINAGYTRANAFVLRVVGDDHEPKQFTVWGAKALAGIALERHLPDATMSRAIELKLRRKLPHESVTRLRHADPGLFESITAKLARFANDYSHQIKEARPALPDSLSDRAQDNWEPLLAIAECAGPEWLQRATAAAVKLSNSGEEAVSTGNELLSDIRQVFASKRVDKISSADLIEELCKVYDAPWPTYNRGKALSPRQLSKHLAGYGIKSKTVRFGRETPKGFEASQFVDAFARYVAAPPTVPPPRNESHKSSNGKASDDAANPPPICNAADVAPPDNETVEASTGKLVCTWPAPLAQDLDPKTGECLITADCGGVADVSPVLGGSGLKRPDAGF